MRTEVMGEEEEVVLENGRREWEDRRARARARDLEAGIIGMTLIDKFLSFSVGREEVLLCSRSS
jgi:hypothetical protein